MIYDFTDEEIVDRTLKGFKTGSVFMPALPLSPRGYEIMYWDGKKVRGTLIYQKANKPLSATETKRKALLRMIKRGRKLYNKGDKFYEADGCRWGFIKWSWGADD